MGLVSDQRRRQQQSTMGDRHWGVISLRWFSPVSQCPSSFSYSTLTTNETEVTGSDQIRLCYLCSCSVMQIESGCVRSAGAKLYRLFMARAVCAVSLPAILLYAVRPCLS